MTTKSNEELDLLNLTEKEEGHITGSQSDEEVMEEEPYEQLALI